MKLTKGMLVILFSGALVLIIRFFGYHNALMFWFIGIAAMGISVKVDGGDTNSSHTKEN